MRRTSGFILFLAARAALPQGQVYEIQRAPSPVTIDARLDEEAWRLAPPVSDFIFNWYESGEKEQTVARLLWDDDNLYVSWQCKDRHISAYETVRHGPVSKDDCVEIFLSPNPAKVTNYYTFEINAIGTMLNRCRTDWWQGPPTWEPDGVQYRTTFQGMAKKDESADDHEWIVEMAIPLRNFSRDAANMPPRDGDRWRLNLQRLGGKTNPQLSTWSPIAPPSRTFHTPASFGTVVFVDTLAGADQVAEGRELYNRSCTMCHGLDGAAGDRAPALGAQRRYIRRTSDEVFDAIKNGIPGTLMPGSPMAENNVWKIVGYIRSLRATAADVRVAGDPVKGERIFQGKGQCTQCHMIAGRGGLVGPELSNIAGERKLADLRAALTQAKEHIPPGYRPVTLVTRQGARIEGVVKNENNFSLQVLGRDGKLYLLDRDEVSRLDYGEHSLMPTDYGSKLSADEMQDLLAFLSRQSRRARR